jgi:hypothetical protein
LFHEFSGPGALPVHAQNVLVDSLFMDEGRANFLDAQTLRPVDSFAEERWRLENPKLVPNALAKKLVQRVSPPFDQCTNVTLVKELSRELIQFKNPVL